MNEEQFSAMLAILVPPVIERVIENSNIYEDKAVSCFYQSELYK